MSKTFSHYYERNELCIKLVLLPFTIVFWLIKKLVQVATKRLVNKKH